MLCLPGLEVTGTNSNEVVVRMPVNTEDSGAYRLLDMLAHPPGRWRGGWREGWREGGKEGGMEGGREGGRDGGRGKEVEGGREGGIEGWREGG